MTPTKLPTAQAVATEFTKIILEWLTRSEIQEIIHKNRTEKYAGNVCATHDHCDANMAMMEAFSNLGVDALSTGDDGSRASDEVLAIWDEASAIAKRNEFRRELHMTDLGTYAFTFNHTEITGFLSGENSIDQYDPRIEDSESIPKGYGFKVTDTGGGCTAWHQPFMLNGKKVHMLITTDQTHEVAPTDLMIVGVYDDDFGDEGILVWEQAPFPLDAEANVPTFLHKRTDETSTCMSCGGSPDSGFRNGQCSACASHSEVNSTSEFNRSDAIKAENLASSCQSSDVDERPANDRIEVATEAAHEAFWLKVADHFPEAKYGDFPPDAEWKLRAAMKEAVAIWVAANT